jgi:hypothetical protein
VFFNSECSTHFLITSAPNCAADKEDNEPPKDPIAVLNALVITISLVSSATAGELSVTGTAKATYSHISGGASNGSNNGKGLGVANELDFSAKGELDNGWTWNYQVQLDPGNRSGSNNEDVQNDDSQLTLSTNFGTVGVFISEGGLNVDDAASASVYGRATDLGITDGIVEGAAVDGSNSLQYHTPAGLLPFGSTFKVAYVPNKGNNDGASANASGGAYSLFGNTAHQYQITTKPIEGLTVYADYYVESGAGRSDRLVVQQMESGSVAASYVTGPIKIGVSKTLNAPLILSGSATTTEISGNSSTTFNSAAARLYTTNKYSIAFNATENLSVSYEHEKSNRELIANATENDLKAKAIQAAYTMGGMTVALSHATVDNASYTANNDSTETLIAVSMAF